MTNNKAVTHLSGTRGTSQAWRGTDKIKALLEEEGLLLLIQRRLVQHFDSAVMFDIAIVALGGEAVEIGAVGHVGRIPEVAV